MELVPDCNIPLAIPFSELHNTVNIPAKPYPELTQSLGSHIKRARLERKIPIKDVIEILKVGRETLRAWETEISAPSVKQYPAIINFIGYNPFTFSTDSFAAKIRMYRYVHGLTMRAFARLVGKDPCVVWEWESNGRNPLSASAKEILKKIGYI